MKFQFTPLHERQLDFLDMSAGDGRISIHASTWEAASRFNPSGRSPLFQFTPLHERQLKMEWRNLLRNILFQFTPLHERQRKICIALFYGSIYFNSRLYMRGSETADPGIFYRDYFNSRLYMRGSWKLGLKKEMVFISIHASTWEAAGKASEKEMEQIISIHASTWEAAYQTLSHHLLQPISIHASTWEAAAKIHNFFNKIDTIFYQTLFFYSNFSEGSLFFNSSSIFLINCIFLPAPMSHKKMYESHQRTHF